MENVRFITPKSVNEFVNFVIDSPLLFLFYSKVLKLPLIRDMQHLSLFFFSEYQNIIHKLQFNLQIHLLKILPYNIYAYNIQRVFV